MSSVAASERNEAIRERVIAAREIQTKRYGSSEGVYCNAQMSSNQMKQFCQLSAAGANMLKAAMQKLNLSTHAYDRILKVSRTIADLGNCDNIRPEHVAEAIQYRSLDRENWSG